MTNVHLTPRTIVMTGATSGMGLDTARALLGDARVHLIAGVRSPERADALSALSLERLTAVPLDLASLASVAAFSDAVRTHIVDRTIDALILNAGIQITTGLERTADGIEKTFAVNHLAHWLIAERLKDRLTPGARVVVTTSGTHDPDDPVAKRFGFRGGVFPSAEKVVRGELDATAKPAQQCLDRYATSKMANIMHVLYQARTDADHSWIAYDPGLMPGTGLARDRGAVERFAWNYVMPVFRLVMTGVSTPRASGAMLARLAQGEHVASSGAYIEFSGKALTPWQTATDQALQEDLERTSAALTKAFA